MNELKYLTEIGLQSIRGATERAYARRSVSVNLPVTTMLALLAEIDRLVEVKNLPYTIGWRFIRGVDSPNEE